MAIFEIPTVTTDRLRLRAFSSRRPRCLCDDASRPGSDALSGHGPYVYPSQSLADDGHISWGVGVARSRDVGVRKIDNGAFVGSVGVFQPLDWPEPEIAYSLDRPCWRQGFATEAARAACEWLFAHFPLPRTASFIRPDNHASKRVAERLGAVYECTFELRGSTL
jgi:RimJ/RimL family protein N-acetyltransferase